MRTDPNRSPLRERDLLMAVVGIVTVLVVGALVALGLLHFGFLVVTLGAVAGVILVRLAESGRWS
ncbi:hypothetical protein [Nocardia mexicana]|uniref:Uncharacterized protein n=1 Tax=Nocardia mexicana TaxID=279262 RepID=A0A370HDR6_9NOCA|nr:hypothetical protein [Nocardia mexicana]RDI55195.1 hypothetical protein DFR68_10127 [Nocardia mexicana]